MMKIIYSSNQIQRLSRQWLRGGQSVGFVPTMGALHSAHLALIGQARKENDLVVVSIFVNPLQFGPSEDYLRYPRPWRKDRFLCQEAGVDYLFRPKVADFYSSGFQTFVEVTRLSQVLCGASRPGHFRGVTTVLAKLFNLIQPSRAYFGEKDYQQLRVVERMVKDLNFPLEIVSYPLQRGKDNLAISSRNRYLSPEERSESGILPRILFHLQKAIGEGITSDRRLRGLAWRLLNKTPRVKLEYLSFVDPLTLVPKKTVTPPVVIALAARVGHTRLIDNLLVRHK